MTYQAMIGLMQCSTVKVLALTPAPLSVLGSVRGSVCSAPCALQSAGGWEDKF